MIRALLKRISYHPVPAAIVRALHLQSVARRAYYRLFHRPGTSLEVQCGGISAQFHVPDAQEFRTIELAIANERTTLESVLSMLRPGDVFWDIGSNRGLFALLAAKRVGPEGKVFAFEPENGCYARLVANIDLNRLGNIHPMQVALSDHTGLGALTRTPRDGLSQGSRLVETGTDDTVTVEVREGDRLGLPTPQVVKIDVEGHEYLTLSGLKDTLSQEQCRALFCEIHPDRLSAGIDSDAVCELIKTLGFRSLHLQSCGHQLQAAAWRPPVDLTAHVPAKRHT